MYLPRYFREDRIEVLHALMRDFPLATIVTNAHGRLEGNHIPVYLVPDKGKHGVLRAHINRNNHMVVDHDPACEALVIFQGPASYVTPTWSPTTAETGKVVPTWNYATVHAHGHLRTVENPKWLREQVATLTRQLEERRTAPWGVERAPVSFLQGQLKGIIGLEVRITSIEGKWKVSQNRPQADREGISRGLAEEGEFAMAALVTRGNG